MKKIIISFFMLLSICMVAQDEIETDSTKIETSIDSSFSILNSGSTTENSTIDTPLLTDIDTLLVPDVKAKKGSNLVVPTDFEELKGEKKPEANKSNSSVLAPILMGIGIGIALLGTILFLIFNIRKKRVMDNTHDNNNNNNTDNSNHSPTKAQSLEKNNIVEETAISTSKEEAPLEQIAGVEPIVNKKFILVGDSVIGKSHIQSELPCQDSHFYCHLENDWYLAVVADGAGSASMSDKGAELVAKRGVKDALKSLKVQDNGWFSSGEFPSDEEWNKIAKASLRKIYDALYSLSANTEGLSIKSLACTVIFALVRHNGILATHIGDGRAGYKNSNGEWKPMMTPFKGEEANQTVFITSDIWKENDIDTYIESRVIREDIEAFTLLSDGCESHAFECSVIDTESGNWSDPNKPFDKFYEPLIKQIYKMKEDTSEDDMMKSWNELLTKGTTGLENESDDKTMILGVLEKPQLLSKNMKVVQSE